MKTNVDMAELYIFFLQILLLILVEYTLNLHLQPRLNQIHLHIYCNFLCMDFQLVQLINLHFHLFQLLLMNLYVHLHIRNQDMLQHYFHMDLCYHLLIVFLLQLLVCLHLRQIYVMDNFLLMHICT